MIGSPEPEVRGECGSWDSQLEGALSGQCIQPLHCAGGSAGGAALAFWPRALSCTPAATRPAQLGAGSCGARAGAWTRASGYRLLSLICHVVLEVSGFTFWSFTFLFS